MKKINLIEWLSRNSHEKQKPQRFARYAAMLIMLLTLGVGQMRSDDITIYVIGNIFTGTGDDAWDNSTSSIKVDVRYQGSENNFKEGDTYFNQTMTKLDATYRGYPIYSYTFTPTYGGGQYRFKHYKNSVWKEDKKISWSSENGKIYDGSWRNYGEDRSIYVHNDVSWAAVKLYTYNPERNGNWNTSSGGVTDQGDGWYKVDVVGAEYFILHSSADGNANKTIDKKYNTVESGRSYHLVDGSDSKKDLAEEQLTVTVNMHGHDESYSSYAGSYYYNELLTEVTEPSASGYIFGGWFKESTYDNEWDFANDHVTSDLTLHAKWLPQSLTITSHPDYLTTTSKLNLSISYANIPEGYCFRVHELRTNGYYNSEAHGAYDPISGTGSTTYTSSAYLPTGDVDRIVVELWKITPFEIQSVVSNEVAVTVEWGYEVSVQAKTDDIISTAGGTVSPSSVSPTAHIGQTITASEPTTGYNFNGWTKNTDNITIADASALSTTVYATAGGTVYANYVRQVGSYSTTFYAGDHGSINAKGTAIAKNGSASVTIGENETLSATPETGYVFDHWGTTGSVSVANIYNATTTVTATDAGGTVTAYYRHRPELGDVTTNKSGTQNYEGEPIDFALSVTSTYLAHPVVVFLVNDGSTTYEVVGAPYGADGSSAAGTIGSDAANTTVHKATFTASAAKSYTVSAKLYEGLLVENFETADYTIWGDINGGTFSTVTNSYQQAGNGSSHVKQITPNGADWHTAITRTTTAWNNDYQYIHAKMYYQGGTGLKWKISDSPATELSQTIGSTNTWQDVAFNNSGRVTIAFMFPFVAGQTNTFYIDDIILSNEASMTEKASQAATASFSINWNYTVTLNNNGATSAGTESVNVTYGSATGITDITVPTKTGYTFGGYYTADAGAGTLQINASGVWQNAAYVADGKWNSGSNQTLYAKWTENMRNVTISAGTGGTVDKTSASVGVATTTTVTATAYPGYRFTGWTATDCSVASTSSASTTLSGNGTTGDATLVANFARTYAYIEGRMTVYNAARSTETHVGSSIGKWSESSFNIAMDYDATNHRFYRHTYKTPAELSATQTDGTAQSQWFSIARSNASGSWSGKTTYHPSDNTDLTTTGIGQKKAAQTSTTSANYKFNSSTTNGYAIIYFDEAGVWYELEHSLIYHANYAASGTSGTAPATEYYQNGFAATAAEKGDLTMTNYTFSGWNTDEHITGTSYAVGSSITMNANKDLYAVWKRSIPMDDQDATTGVSNTVYGTYNCTTLSEYTNPEKIGYTFNGWYTQEAGGGNYVISPEKELQPGVYHWTNYDNNTNEFMRSPTSISSLYAKWTQTVTLNANLANHGSGDNTSATIVYKATAKTSITHCTPATGYHLEGYYTAATDGVKVLNADGSFASSAVTDYITDGKWTKAGATTLYAHYEGNTYTVTLAPNGGSGSNQTVTATYDAAMPSTLSGGGAIVAPNKTGYAFGGYWYESTQYYAANLSSVTNWNRTSATTLNAKWTPNPYTIVLDKQTSAEGYGSEGTVEDQTVTFDATPATVSGTMPSAANGYAFMGFYSAIGGNGRRFIDPSGNWVTSAGDTISGGNWVKPAGITLYAYYKKAEITGIALSSGTVLPEGSVTATATIEPTPTPTTIICWKLLYNNGTEYSPQPTFTPVSGSEVSFNAPEASGTYKVQAQLRTGGVCGGGTLLSENETSFIVAGTHNVTIQYKCDGVNVKAATVVEGVKPLEWSETITPGEAPFGYRFDHWEAGDGVTISTNGTSAIGGTTTTTSTIYIQAIYDGRLTAVYTKKNIVYFKNTFGWTNVYYHDSYWDNSKGGAGNKSQSHINQAMSLVPGTTNIYYWEGTPTSANVAFTNATYDNYQAFWSKTFDAKVVYPSNPTCASSDDANYGYNAGTPMFVPVEQDGQDFNAKDGGKAIYYNKGYWRAYDPTTGESGSTGYTLKIYNKTEDSSRELLQSIPFTNADASGQIFKATAGLNAAGGYGIKVERDNSMLYTNTEGHLHRTGDVVTMSVNPSSYKAIWIKATAAGDYDFIITCDNDGKLCLQATFPAAKNDYRVLYTDNATWSNAAHVKQTWVHPSRVISAAAGATDTISFFVSKDNSPEYKIQRVSGIDEGTGAITWADVTSWTSISVAKTGVYNFIFNQPAAGSISLSKTEEYDGNFYIRTNNAGSTKWENYRTSDHEMTYSEYAAKITHTGEEWKDFTHYFMKYVDKDKESGKYKNVMFTVANDYSPCISDTLVQQAGDIATSHVNASGDLQANANIRFMWNIKNNKLQRAYLAAAQSDGTKFLVLQGKSGELLAPDGTALSDENNNNHGGGTDAIQFTDKEHWMYDAEVKAVPGGRVKLYAVFNGSTFYYYGDGDASFDESHAIELISGSGGAQDIRVIYDFKTDRLIAAWVPSDGDINAPQTINADIMLIREHQNAGKQINLTGTGSISTNKTVYGVMRFNRWTLNNKSTTNTGTTENPVHAVLPVGEQKSQYERFNYMISFPFDVKVGEIFGFGTIGRHYRIYYYDGLGRAKEGFFAERGDDNWRMIDDTDSILHANQGYLLQLNYIRMADDNTATWPQKNMNEVELYFPAMNAINTISLADVEIPALGDAYKCKINLKPIYEERGDPKADEADRRVKDSYWRCIGVPGFTSYEANAGTWVNFNWKAETDSLPYLYEWHMENNKLSVVSSSTFTFKPMHAYLIQNGKSFTWTSVAHPTVAAPRRSAAEEGFYEFYLEMQNGEQALDHTYVRLTDKENITADFDFGQDLSKELNSGANIFTKVGYERLAANNLPLSEQTTIVPVGVKIAEEGNYTFAMPEGTHGIGVTLVDNETGDRTNLSLFDYSVNLTKGDYDNRFLLEISPIVQSPTGIELFNGENGENGVRKVLIDNILYIVKDGIVYDAQGHRVQ